MRGSLPRGSTLGAMTILFLGPSEVLQDTAMLCRDRRVRSASDLANRTRAHCRSTRRALWHMPLPVRSPTRQWPPHSQHLTARCPRGAIEPIKCEVLDEDGRRRLLGYARLRNEHAGAAPQPPANCAVENAGQPFSAGQRRVASSSDESGGKVRTALAALPRVPQRPGSHHDGIGIRMASDTAQPRAFSLRQSLVRDGGSRCAIRRRRRIKPRPAGGIRACHLPQSSQELLVPLSIDMECPVASWGKSHRPLSPSRNAPRVPGP